MQYFRCKCGNKEMINSGLPVHDCEGCEDCQTTFAQTENGHKSLIPHDFTRISYNPKTGKPYKTCSRCHTVDETSYTESCAE